MLAGLLQKIIFSNGLTRVFISIISGAIVTLAMPPFNYLSPLFVSFPIFLLMIDGSRNARQAFWTGWAFGFGHFVTGLYWICYSLLVEPDKFAWLVPFCASLLPAFLAIYIGIIGFLMRLVPINGWSRIVLFSCVWTIIELLRGFLFTGFPWNLIGYVWAKNLAILQVTSLVGVFGLSLFTLLIFSIPYVFFSINETKKISCQLKSEPIIMVAIIFFVAWRWGDYHLAKNPSEFTNINIHLVQANIAQHFKWDDDKRMAHLMKHIQLSKESLSKTSPQEENYVIWSETSVPYVLEQEKPLLNLINESFPDNVFLFTGSLRVMPEDENNLRAWNSLYTIRGDGNIVGHYDKVKLVPFGEFVPFRKFLPFIDKITYGTGDFSSGEGPLTMQLEGVEPFSPLICYEIIFPEYSTARNARPSWLLNITNDAWFGDSTGPYQHQVMASVRSIEYGLPLVRSANTGISTVVDSYGRLIDSMALNTEGVITTKLPQSAQETFFSKYRNVPVYVIISLLLILVLLTQISSFQSARAKK